ncbi:hypothetical protein RFI_29108 [Reticulomyxa filosa]|uniref:Uncharacterized protein n=1 Tax=Reticulomyxa filosa TaxID=46433 RepID=X6M2W6_RETFI|nr:hypothetical protein RFI_29108 [Reticulomyxa filosa]|eukprot:ETO08279.1 hypothetical protein RFI_29108 [Reticulomyxa filosa]
MLRVFDMHTKDTTTIDLFHKGLNLTNWRRKNQSNSIISIVRRLSEGKLFGNQSPKSKPSKENVAQRSSTFFQTNIPVITEERFDNIVQTQGFLIENKSFASPQSKSNFENDASLESDESTDSQQLLLGSKNQTQTTSTTIVENNSIEIREIVKQDESNTSKNVNEKKLLFVLSECYQYFYFCKTYPFGHILKQWNVIRQTVSSEWNKDITDRKADSPQKLLSAQVEGPVIDDNTQKIHIISGSSHIHENNTNHKNKVSLLSELNKPWPHNFLIIGFLKKSEIPYFQLFICICRNSLCFKNETKYLNLFLHKLF